MFKKILLYVTLVLSFVLMLTAIVDLCVVSVSMFENSVLRWMMLLTVLLSAVITGMTCVIPKLHRPLLLAIDLVQTILGGEYTVYFVFDLCFPDQLQLGALLPIVMGAIALASLIQAVAMVIGLNDSEGEENLPAASRGDWDDLSPDNPGAIDTKHFARQSVVHTPKTRMSGKELVAAKMALSRPSMEDAMEHTPSPDLSQQPERKASVSENMALEAPIPKAREKIETVQTRDMQSAKTATRSSDLHQEKVSSAAEEASGSDAEAEVEAYPSGDTMTMVVPVKKRTFEERQ